MKEDKRGIAEQLVDFLEEHPGDAFSAAELTECLDAVYDIVIKKLCNLTKHHEVEFERVSCKIAKKIYKNPNLKRGMNLYFLD